MTFYFRQFWKDDRLRFDPKVGIQLVTFLPHILAVSLNEVTYEILNYCLLFFRSWYVCMVSDCILDISVLDLHKIIWYIKFFEPSTIHFNKKIHAWWNELLTCRLLLCLCSAMVSYRCYKCYILLSLPFLEYCRSFYDLERVREACGGGRLHQADLGSRHVFREREGGAVSCRHTGLIMFCCCLPENAEMLLKCNNKKATP